MTLAELKKEIDAVVDWIEGRKENAHDVHVFIPRDEGGRTEDIELKLTLGPRRRLYIDPK